MSNITVRETEEILLLLSNTKQVVKTAAAKQSQESRYSEQLSHKIAVLHAKNKAAALEQLLRIQLLLSRTSPAK